MSDERKERLGIIGIGAAACAACCAGPILAFLGGLSLAGLASTLLIGTLGLAVFVASGVGYLVVRRRRQTACAHRRPSRSLSPRRHENCRRDEKRPRRPSRARKTARPTTLS